MHKPFTPTRAVAEVRLAHFLRRAGRDYARDRNTDRGPDNRENVSGLSPWVRHRVLTEEEIVRAVLAQHRFSDAEKFIQEVCWRTYWKGWLELRPSVWSDYLAAVAADRQRLEGGPDAERLAAAEGGRTGIAAFDAWVSELVDTGYLHNHTRMWFASIWIFTLRLPWTLGADVFLRHLLDGDPASNTLSWRWVAGLHTRGKTYLARADNIETYTLGRFRPTGLALSADPVVGPAPPIARPIAAADPVPDRGPLLVLLMEDDLSPESWGLDADAVTAIVALESDWESQRLAAPVREFKRAAMVEALQRGSRHFGCPAGGLADAAGVSAVVAHAQRTGARTVVTMAPPIGPARDALDRAAAAFAASGLVLVRARRPWDQSFWPHAGKGFFQFKEHIPAVFASLGVTEPDLFSMETRA